MASLDRTSYDTVNDVRFYFDIVPGDNNVEEYDECNYTDPLHRSGQHMQCRRVVDQIQQSAALNATNTNNNKTDDIVARKRNVFNNNNKNFYSISKNDTLLSSPNPSIDGISNTRSPVKKLRRPSNISSLSNFLFGFMYDDDSENDDDDDGYYSDESIDHNNNMNNIRNSSRQQENDSNDNFVRQDELLNNSLIYTTETIQGSKSKPQNFSLIEDFYSLHSINEPISHETNLKQIKLDDTAENVSTNITLAQPITNGYKYRLNYLALCATLLLQSLVCCLPVALVNPMSNEFSINNSNKTTINTRLLIEYQSEGSEISIHKQSSTYFVSQVTAASVLGTSCGKLVNGPTVDIVGARRSSIRNSILLCFAFLMLAIAQSPQTAIHSCFLVEFANSVQWPCNVVLLSSHTSLTPEIRKNDNLIKHSNDDEQVNETKLFNNGIFITVLASRCGSLIGIPLWSYCIRLLLHQSSMLNHLQVSLSAWRLLAGFGAWISLVTTSITYLYIHDTPHHTNHSSNPVDPKLLYQVRQKWNDLLLALSGHQRHSQRSSPLHDASPLFDETYEYVDDAAISDRKHGVGHRKNSINTIPSTRIRRRRFIAFVYTLVRAGLLIIRTNIVPSVLHVTRNGVFWIIALAHSGSSMVKSSERIIATYLLDTNVDGTLQPSTASSLSVFLSIGIVLGLLIAGKVFSITTNPRERKYIVSRLYLLSIVSLYILALLGISSIRIRVPSTLLLRLQLASIILIGFGIAVQCYHIPSIVGALTFAKPYQGLFASYVDGVAYGLSSFVWRIVGNTVHPISTSSTTSSSTKSGWAYGWATVALLVVLSAILMIEFIEHYMCRRYYHSMMIHNKNKSSATVDLLGIPTLDHKEDEIGNDYGRRTNGDGRDVTDQKQLRRNLSRWGGRFETILLA